MKTVCCSLATLALALLLHLPVASAGAPAILCTSDSTGACSGRQYCCHEGMDSSAGDKYCKNLGCKRGGTGSCPTAANVKSCGTRDHSSVFGPGPDPVSYKIGFDFDEPTPANITPVK